MKKDWRNTTRRIGLALMILTGVALTSASYAQTYDVTQNEDEEEPLSSDADGEALVRPTVIYGQGAQQKKAVGVINFESAVDSCWQFGGTIKIDSITFTPEGDRVGEFNYIGATGDTYRVYIERYAMDSQEETIIRKFLQAGSEYFVRIQQCNEVEAGYISLINIYSIDYANAKL